MPGPKTNNMVILPDHKNGIYRFRWLSKGEPKRDLKYKKHGENKENLLIRPAGVEPATLGSEEYLDFLVFYAVSPGFYVTLLAIDAERTISEH